MLTKHFVQHQNLIRKAAWQRVRQNPNLIFEELEAEGNLAYMEAVETYDPDKGKFSTHLTWRLRHRLGKANSRAIDHDNYTTELNEAMNVPSKESSIESSSFARALEGLGAEARQVVSLILGSAGEFADFTVGSVKVTRGHIQSYLRGWGWKWTKIEAAMGEIKEMLKSL